MEHRKLKRVGIVIAAVVVMGALAATAVAVLTGDVGGTQLRVETRGENAPTVSNSTVFADVPGAGITVAVPSGATRLIEASFTAESQCAGPGGGGWCSMRIIATNVATGASVELRPQSGFDYAFDADQAGAADDLWEGHAMNRASRLAAGTYRIRAQRAVTNSTISFRLDDWLFTVRTDA